MIIIVNTVVSSLIMLILINNFFVDILYMVDLYSLLYGHYHDHLWF